MTTMEELMQAALVAPEDRKAMAVRVLRGEPAGGVGEGRKDTERFLTLRECARRLGVSSCSLWRWGVPGHVLGGRRKFRISEVEAYLESNEFRERAAELREEVRGMRAGNKGKDIAR